MDRSSGNSEWQDLREGVLVWVFLFSVEVWSEGMQLDVRCCCRDMGLHSLLRN